MTTSNRRIGVAGCKHTTGEFIVGLLRAGFPVAHCITIAPEKGDEQRVAGYDDLRPLLDRHAIPFYVAEKYSLKSDKDREALIALKLDVLLVIGWQRLIPEWYLAALSVGAFGMHGSSKPLPYGRGRSPLNWSLIQNKSAFFTHLFRYKPGVDDGDIVGVQVFEISPFDTCLTLHLKNTISMIRLCTEHLPALLEGRATYRQQSTDSATYYPQRTADDGLIHWTQGTYDIYNLVRAVTKPFPGAFTFLDDRGDQRLVIWGGIPFDRHLQWRAPPGAIVEVFHDGKFIVQTGDYSFLVTEYEGALLRPTDVGRALGDLGTPQKVWKDLPL